MRLGGRGFGSPEKAAEHLKEKSSKGWARDFEGFETKLFPAVLMPEAPPPVDSVRAQPVHWYPRLNR
jgi:hypothetical protein